MEIVMAVIVPIPCTLSDGCAISNQNMMSESFQPRSMMPNRPVASQEAVGRQCVFQFEFLDDSSSIPSIEQFNQVMQETIHEALWDRGQAHPAMVDIPRVWCVGVVILAIVPNTWQSKPHFHLKLHNTLSI